MPRKAPKEVIEHRVTLGNFERNLLVEELADSKQNQMKVAGINQVGQIAGSGVLLWGLAAYFGYNLISEIKDTIWGITEPISTGLSNMWMTTFGGLTSYEANFVSKINAALNQRVLELNAREEAKEQQIRSVQMALMSGDITFQEGKAALDMIGEVPSAETIEERQSIVDARARLASLKAELDESAFQNLIDNWPSFNSDGVANLVNAI